jgi:hypothetical protein
LGKHKTQGTGAKKVATANRVGGGIRLFEEGFVSITARGYDLPILSQDLTQTAIMDSKEWLKSEIDFWYL